MSQSRAVVITEASSAVALAAGARLARDGNLVLLGSRRINVCEWLTARLRRDGAAAFAAYLDLADPCSIDRFVESARYLIGTVDVLVTTVGLTDGSWLGAQHLAAQVIPPMIKNRHGDVVLISPELVGTPSHSAPRILNAWVAGLEAEFVGTGVRASIIRSAPGAGAARPDDIGCLIAAMLGSAMHLRAVDVIPPLPGSALARKRRW